jgi:hypothetical protein
VLRRLLTLAVFVLLQSAVSAQPASPPSPQKDPVKASKPPDQPASPAPQAPTSSGAEQPEVDVHFLNGSLLRLLVRSEALEIATDYGRLVVPVKDIQSIEFGLRFPDGVENKIQAAISELGGAEYRTRDRAGKALLELAPYSYPAVLAASRSKELEVSRRARELLKQIESKHPKKALKTSAEDRVVTRSFPIVGRILTRSLKARTDLFGEVELGLAKMESLKGIAAPGPSSNVTVSVDAAKYARHGEWMETEVEVNGRSVLTITAKGVVDTWPQQPNQWITTPNGVQGGRVFVGGNIIVGGIARQMGGAQNLQMNGGALFGRIGTSGEPFFIGERYNGTPEGEGKLYLTIAPSPWNCPSTGSYEVKIDQESK